MPPQAADNAQKSGLGTPEGIPSLASCVNRYAAASARPPTPAAYWISILRAEDTVCCFLGMVSFSTPSAYSAFRPLSSIPLISKER